MQELVLHRQPADDSPLPPAVLINPVGSIKFGQMWLLVLALVAAVASHGAPRLLIDETQAARLRRLAAVKGSPHEEMLGLLRDKAESAAKNPALSGTNYDRAYHATIAAFLHQITSERRYCAAAWDSLRAVYEGADAKTVLPEQGYGLARATVGSGFALAYDWCRDAWTPRQRDWVEQRLRAALKAWRTFGHANLKADHKGSNWVAVCRGGELLELLALGLEKQDAERYALLKGDLLQHMRNYDELGVSQEGIGYTAYGGIFLLRALLALRTVGDMDLEAEAARHAWWKQAMYSGTFASGGDGRLWLMSGVSNSRIGDEGWASLLFAFTPADYLPYFKWWYDRHLGQRSPGSAGSRFDPRREGTVWAMICYPAEVAAQDPTGVFPPAVAGSSGLVWFRNRWQDADDLLFSFHADARWHSHAWDQPEALQFHLFGYGTSFAGGPEKTREPGNFSTLLVDGRHVAEKARGTTGKLVSFKPTAHGGVAVASGGSQYASLGVEAQRTFRVEFLPGNRARVQIRDQVMSPVPRRYTWQMNLGDHASDGGIRAAKDFVLTSGRGRVRGKVLSPREARVEPGDPYRVEVDAAALDLQVELEIEPAPDASKLPRPKLSLPGDVPLELVTIPPGTYRRGSPPTEAGRDEDEGPQHEVRISRAFQMGIWEVTQRQWVAVMGENPAAFQQPSTPPTPDEDPLDRPVESVSWLDVQRYIERLNALGLGRFRLPTEAEWEYAARAGMATAYPWGDSDSPDRVHEFSWANSRSYATTHAAGRKPPNAWGLYDMHGNVWEWCADWYGPYSPGAQTDPTGPGAGAERVFRGGSWYDFPKALRSANRHRHVPHGRYPAVGFRIVREPEDDRVRTVRLPGGTELRLVRIPAGQFVMGSPESEAGRASDEGPLHTVTISRSFWMGVFEVTQRQWLAVMNSNPSTFQRFEASPDHPVERVSWRDAMEFLGRLNALGLGQFRLPTEAEWEYAARAGSQTPLSFGEDADYRALTEHAWFYSRAEGRSHPVGGKRPNAWGLYDMHGNVWEWCSDWFGAYPGHAVTDPQGPATGRERVIRGGSWFNEPEALRSANRHRHPPDSRQTNLGFRVVMED